MIIISTWKNIQKLFVNEWTSEAASALKQKEEEDAVFDVKIVARLLNPLQDIKLRMQ